MVHKRFSLWSKISLRSKKGVWEMIFKVLSEDGDNEYAMIDSTIVRAHQHSSGAGVVQNLKPLGGVWVA